MADEKLELTRRLGAPPAEVFAAWTDPAILGRWFAPGEMWAQVAELDARPGGRFRVEMHHPSGVVHTVSGSYREVEPNRRLVFTWAWEGEAAPETTVTVQLRPVGDGTELVLTHEGFPSRELAEQHAQGWGGSTQKLAGLFAAVGADGAPG